MQISSGPSYSYSSNVTYTRSPSKTPAEEAAERRLKAEKNRIKAEKKRFDNFLDHFEKAKSTSKSLYSPGGAYSRIIHSKDGYRRVNEFRQLQDNGKVMLSVVTTPMEAGLTKPLPSNFVESVSDQLVRTTYLFSPTTHNSDIQVLNELINHEGKTITPLNSFLLNVKAERVEEQSPRTAGKIPAGALVNALKAEQEQRAKSVIASFDELEDKVNALDGSPEDQDGQQDGKVSLLNHKTRAGLPEGEMASRRVRRSGLLGLIGLKEEEQNPFRWISSSGELETLANGKLSLDISRSRVGSSQETSSEERNVWLDSGAVDYKSAYLADGSRVLELAHEEGSIERVVIEADGSFDYYSARLQENRSLINHDLPSFEKNSQRLESFRFEDNLDQIRKITSAPNKDQVALWTEFGIEHPEHAAYSLQQCLAQGLSDGQEFATKMSLKASEAEMSESRKNDILSSTLKVVGGLANTIYTIEQIRNLAADLLESSRDKPAASGKHYLEHGIKTLYDIVIMDAPTEFFLELPANPEEIDADFISKLLPTEQA